jgi:hypothetical protein
MLSWQIIPVIDLDQLKWTTFLRSLQYHQRGQATAMHDLIPLDPSALITTEQDVRRLFGENEKSASTRHAYRLDFAAFSACINWVART